MILSKVSSEVSLKNIGSRGLDSIHDESLKNIGTLEVVDWVPYVHFWGPLWYNVLRERRAVTESSRRPVLVCILTIQSNYGSLICLTPSSTNQQLHSRGEIANPRPPGHSCRASSGRASVEYKWILNSNLPSGIMSVFPNTVVRYTSSFADILVQFTDYTLAANEPPEA